jgi:hypothetical protein
VAQGERRVKWSNDGSLRGQRVSSFAGSVTRSYHSMTESVDGARPLQMANCVAEEVAVELDRAGPEGSPRLWNSRVVFV